LLPKQETDFEVAADDSDAMQRLQTQIEQGDRFRGHGPAPPR
jgi:hypothetical protein